MFAKIFTTMRVAFCLVLVLAIYSVDCNVSTSCNLTTELVSEIRTYEKVVQLIERYVVDQRGAFRNVTWTKLANFVDDFGSRPSGSRTLEDAIDFLLDEFKRYELDNVHTENVSVPHWVRNKEFAILHKPKGSATLSLLGIGGSIGTPENGINASVMVVQSFEELQERLSEVPDKIVVFNQHFVNYQTTVKYRWKAANEASKLGAVAVLVRSVGPFSIGSPHTGALFYDDHVQPIPAACITMEDADMLNRLHRRGVPLTIHLFMGGRNLALKVSRNLVGEIQGKSNSEQVVIVSGHVDSWDVGQGAMDDGGGVFVSWMSLVVMRRLGLRPKRTVRTVLWTAGEYGHLGARSYLNDHKSDLRNFTLMMESDGGTFSPTGLIFFGSTKASCIMKEILKLMTPFNSTTLERHDSPVESDISIFQKYGVPGAGLRADDEKHFWFHHTEGDTMALEQPSNLDRCLALFTAVAYVVADLELELPRKVGYLFEGSKHEGSRRMTHLPDSRS